MKDYELIELLDERDPEWRHTFDCDVGEAAAYYELIHFEEEEDMSVDRYIDKESSILLSRESGFYCVPAPEGIEDKYFDYADAVRKVINTVEEMGSVGDVLTPQQIDDLNAAWEEFEEAVSGDYDEIARKLKGKELELGRVKAKLKKLEEANSDE